MKLTAVNNRQIRQNNQNKQRQNVNFKGIPEAMVGFWKIVDSSRGIQFTVEDMLGTNIPRTISGAKSGYEYTGKINWPYLWQEGIREFLTGPTMTCAPIAILAIATKLSGKSADTHVKNIVNLSHIAQNLENKGNLTEEAFKEDFLTSTIKDALKLTTDGNYQQEDVDKLLPLIKKYASESNSSGKQAKKQAKATLGSIQKTFESIVKARKTSYEGVDFKTVAYSTVNEKTGATNFENYVKYMSAYIEDYTKANKGADGFINLTKDAIDKFRDSWCLKRAGVVGAMVFLTGIIMSFIPKLYTLASGGINPGGKAIYDEASKREGK